MRKRTGDWRDLLSAYTYALDVKKIYVGALAVLVTVLIMAAAVELYSIVGGPAGSVRALSVLRADPRLDLDGTNDFGMGFLTGTGMQKVACFLPLLNPFYGGRLHFCLSLLVYAVLFLAWGSAGGVISRLVALEYARDDLPTLGEARAMVDARRRAYFMAPLMPLLVIVLLAVMNALGGLIASLPYVGPILLVFPGWPMLVFTCIVITFLMVFGVLGYGLMIPGVSVDGKDAFETWSTAYSYALWGLRRFVCYSLILAAIGAVAVTAAWALCELLIYLVYKTVNLGYVASEPWMIYMAQSGAPTQVMLVAKGSGLIGAMGTIIVILMLLVRAVPAAFAFAYFFAANTLLYFLMRKDQDNIEVDEIFEEKAEAPPLTSGSEEGQGQQRAGGTEEPEGELQRSQ